MLYCVTTDGDFPSGTELNIDDVYGEASDNHARFYTYCDSTVIGVVRDAGFTAPTASKKSDGTSFFLDETKWRIKGYAAN